MKVFISVVGVAAWIAAAARAVDWVSFRGQGSSIMHQAFIADTLTAALVLFVLGAICIALGGLSK